MVISSSAISPMVQLSVALIVTLMLVLTLGKILSVDTTAALAEPGVVAYIDHKVTLAPSLLSPQLSRSDSLTSVG